MATAILDIEFTETPQEFTGLEGYDRDLHLIRIQRRRVVKTFLSVING